MAEPAFNLSATLELAQRADAEWVGLLVFPELGLSAYAIDEGRSGRREVLVNRSASNVTIGKARDRRLLCASQSARAPADCVYTAAGPGESTTDLPEIRVWLKVFLTRFFATSQFKRSASPNGPKISPGGSLSPRGDWRAPSDGNARVWLAELKANTPHV